MITFKLIASICKPGLYQDFATGKMGIHLVMATALCDGVNDCDYKEECLLEHVMGVASGYILTYSKDEDMIDVWKQTDCGLK
jgi:hypothetical protein